MSAQARRRGNPGTCCVCGRTLTPTGATRHLDRCVAERLSPQPGDETERVVRMRVYGTRNRDYWMHIEAPASADLIYMDTFLRAIWLECCDHLSHFIIEGFQFETRLYEEDSDRSDLMDAVARLKGDEDTDDIVSGILNDDFLYEMFDDPTISLRQMRLRAEKEGLERQVAAFAQVSLDRLRKALPKAWTQAPTLDEGLPAFRESLSTALVKAGLSREDADRFNDFPYGGPISARRMIHIWTSYEFDGDTPIGRVLAEKGDCATYEYDFGDTTELTLEVTGVREAKAHGKHYVRLLARNDIPEYQRRGPLRTVNSPRRGQCAYDGPTDYPPEFAPPV